MYILLLLLELVLLWLTASSGCNLEGIQVCLYNDELKLSQYTLIFYPEFAEFQRACERQRTLLACAMRNEYVGGCSQEHLVELNGLKNIYKALCLDYVMAYNRSRPCFMQVKDEVVRCERTFRRAREDHCLELQDARQCIRDSVKDKEGCGEEDKMFLGKLGDLILKPYAHLESFNCDMPVFEDEIKKETTTKETTTQETTTQETTTQETTTQTTWTTSAVTTFPTKIEKNTALKLAIVAGDGNSSSKHFPAVTYVAALFMTFLSTYVCIVS